MKPRNIFLIRHGQSEGNVDHSIYQEKPDYAVNLTPYGKQQAFQAGKEIFKILANSDTPTNLTTAIYYSPYFRTIQTAQEILKTLVYTPKKWIREEPRMREQEWNGKIGGYARDEDIQSQRDDYGHFYYRFDGGESCADVYDRASDVLETLHRDFEKDDFPENLGLVGHGMTNRLIIMKWFHLTVTEFEYLANPRNGEVWHLQLQPNNKYKLVTELKKYPLLRRKWVCELTK